MQREKDRARWRRRSVTLVTTSTDNGEVTEHSGRAAMEEAIWSRIHDQRFYLPNRPRYAKDGFAGNLVIWPGRKQLVKFWRALTSILLTLMRPHTSFAGSVRGFSFRSLLPTDETLSKTLFWDISCQAKLSTGLASIDAANCYDSIAHAVASLVFQSFGVPEEAITSMLTAIQEMKYFLRTGYGDSTNCRGSTVALKFQGLCQGNGAAPAG